MSEEGLSEVRVLARGGRFTEHSLLNITFKRQVEHTIASTSGAGKRERRGPA